MHLSRQAVTRLFLLFLAFAIAPVVRAQCAVPKQFASIGNTKVGYVQLRVDPVVGENAGNEIGRFWQSSNSILGNNFGGQCPSQNGASSWWNPVQVGLRGIFWWLSSGACFPNGCPSGDLTLVVEDESTAGDDAVFIGFRVSETPPLTRWWDFARTVPGTSPTTVSMQPFPAPQVTSSLIVGPGVLELAIELGDIADGVHAAVGGPVVPGGIGSPLPATAVVAFYDLYQSVGDGDPGRSANAWTLIAQVPYEDGPGQTTVEVSCPSSGSLFLASGLSFEGGDGPDVPSALVGRAVEVECLEGPLVADAGASHLVECSAPAGTAATLDASASVGADSFSWSAPGVVFDDPTSIQPTGLFPRGTTLVQLTVARGDFTHGDTTEVTVEDTEPPVVSCAVSALGDGQTSVAAGAQDVCCGTTATTAAIGVGWASLPVEDGTVVNVVCDGDDDEGDDEDADCEGIANCGGTLQIRSESSALIVVGTDCSGHSATCTQSLCGGAAPGVALDPQAEPLPGHGGHLDVGLAADHAAPNSTSDAAAASKPERRLPKRGR